MASYNPGGLNPLPFAAGGTIRSFRALKLHSVAGQVVETGAITEVVIGYSGNAEYAAADQIPVIRGQVIKVTASAAISLGAQVMPGADGKVATAAGATAISCGIALEAATADGQVISVLAVPSVNGPANS